MSCFKPHLRFGRSPWTRLTALAMLWVLGGGDGFNPGAADTDEPAVEPRPPETRVAKTNWGVLTIEDIVKYHAARPVKLNFIDQDDIPALSSRKLYEITDWITKCMAAEEEIASLVNPVSKSFIEKYSEDEWTRELGRHLSETHVDARVTEPTEAAIRAYYQDHPFEFPQRYEFYIRHLVLLTFKLYIVQKSDIKTNDVGDLDSIVGRLCGDPALRRLVFSDLVHRPPRHEEDKPFRPLFPGERLLVPMVGAELGAVRRRMEDILRELDAGASFKELADKYSESDHKGRVSGPLPTKGMLESGVQDLIDTVKRTPVGGISPIIKTHHGYQVLEVVSKKERGTKPLEEVRDLVRRKIIAHQQATFWGEIEEMQMRDPDLSIAYDLIARGDKLTTDTVIARVGERQILWQSLKDIWVEHGQPAEHQAIREILKTLDPLQAALINSWAEPMLDHEYSELAQQLGRSRTVMVGEMVMRSRAEEKAKARITREMRGEYYERNKQSAYVVPRKIGFRTIEMTMMGLVERRLLKHEAARAEALAELALALAEILEDVKSPEDFMAWAELVNQELRARGKRPFESREPREFRVVPIKYREPLAGLDPGKWSRPFVLGPDRVAAVLLTERVPGRILAMEEVLDKIDQELTRRLMSGAEADVEAELELMTGFKFLLPLEDPSEDQPGDS